MMKREMISRDNLVELINREFAQSGALNGDCREMRIGGVFLRQEADEAGCNWVGPNYGKVPPGCESEYARIIEKFQSEFNIEE